MHEVEPFTLKETLIYVNKELKEFKYNNPIKKGRLLNLVYNELSLKNVRKQNKRPVCIDYTDVLKVIEHVKNSRVKKYSTNGRKKIEHNS